ncbi:MAG: hypothetical protein IBJ11_12455 [Phycisphaerales bacterium]|nr:hypothetical protein [Phycisphaerales bacterium]
MSTLRDSVLLAVAGAAAAAPCEAAVVYTQGNLAGDATGTRFVALVHQELHRPPMVSKAWSNRGMPTGASQNNVEFADQSSFDTYCLVGVNVSGGVFVSFSNPALGLGRSWDALFPGISEAAVAGAILTNSALPEAFLAVLDNTEGVGTLMGSSSGVVAFSDGVAFGTFIAGFAPVPTPGVLAVFGVVPVLLAPRRRRANPAH